MRRRSVWRIGLATLVALIAACQPTLGERALQGDPEANAMLWCFGELDRMGDVARRLGREAELRLAWRAAPDLAVAQGERDRIQDVLARMPVFRDVCLQTFAEAGAPGAP